MPIKMKDLPRKVAEKLKTSESIAPKVSAKLAKTVQPIDRARPKMPQKPSKFNSGAVLGMWSSAYTSFYPEAAVKRFSEAQRGQAKNLGLSLGENTSSFIEYLFENWTAIRADVFGWMTKAPPPQYPDLGFTLKFLDKLLDCYNGYKTVRKLSASSDERDQVEMMTRTGLSLKEAQQRLERKKVATAAKQQRHAQEASKPVFKAKKQEPVAPPAVIPPVADPIIVQDSKNFRPDSQDATEIATRNGPITDGERLTLEIYAATLLFEDDITSCDLYGKACNEHWVEAVKSVGLEWA